MSFMKKIMDALKLDNTRETKNSSYSFEPDEQTIYFTNGKMYKVHPNDEESWYDARYLVSDNKVYDLEKVEDIKRIPIPNFKRLENDKYGVTGLLDYVLRMKAGAFYNKKEKELCSACLWKATEIMFSNPLCKWSKKDYMRLIYWHMRMGMEDEAKRAKEYLESKGIIIIDYEIREKMYIPKSKGEISGENKKSKQQDNISQIEKERIIVKNVTTDDMRELKSMPFICNTEIKKYIHEGNHPLAYMDLLGENIEIAKLEIEKMNVIIAESIKIYPTIPQNLRIPVSDLVFQSPNYGYTRLKCTPKTFAGKRAKYPYSLYFCTDLSKLGNTTHGELTYGQEGTILKAMACFWRNGSGFFLYFKVIDGVLCLTELGQS